MGRPLAIDAAAETGDENLPAFLARPEGAPVYHGFPILTDVVVDGFVLGKITDFEAESTAEGDAFVVAPDGSRAGLVWEHTRDDYFSECVPFDENRWGVWSVAFPFPMTDRSMAKKNLAHILPKLVEKWNLWRASVGRAK